MQIIGQEKPLACGQTYCYDIPISLQKKFTITSEGVQSHQYYLRSNSSPFGCILIVSMYVGPIQNIFLYGPHPETGLQANLPQENCPKELYSCCYKGTYPIPMKTFECLLAFYKYFSSDLIGLQPGQMATSYFNDQELTLLPEQDNPILACKTYLIIPADSQGEIDQKFIAKYLSFKTCQTRDLLLSVADLQKSCEEKAFEATLRDGIFELHNSKNFQKYYIADIIYNPERQTVKELLEMMSKYICNQDSESLKKLFGLEFLNCEELTINKLFVTTYYKPKNSFIKRLQQKVQGLDPRGALLFVQPPLSPNSFNFNVKENPKQHRLHGSGRKKRILIKAIENFQIVHAQSLIISPLTLPLWDFWIRVPSLMVHFERAVAVNEFSSLNNLSKCRHELLSRALGNSGFDNKENYEVLETLGDSVLKLVVSLDLLLNGDVNGLKDERKLSRRRSQIVCNKNLSTKSELAYTGLYLKNAPRNPQNWRFPLVNFPEKEMRMVISGKALADSFEAIIGALTLSNSTLEPVLEFLQSNGLISDRILACKLVVDQNYYVDADHLHYNSEQITEESNMIDLLNLNLQSKTTANYRKEDEGLHSVFDELNQILLNKQEFTREKMNEILEKIEKRGPLNTLFGYEFKDKHLLLEASIGNGWEIGESPSSFERLEFLGDALIEALVLISATKIFHENDQRTTPDDLQSLKSCLLSNKFMGLISAHISLHCPCFYSKDEGRKEEIRSSEVNQEFEIKFPFKDFYINNYDVSKYLGDIFESHAGAVLLDRGLEAFIDLYGRIYGPYISYFCRYYQVFGYNLLQRLKNEALKQ